MYGSVLCSSESVERCVDNMTLISNAVCSPSCLVQPVLLDRPIVLYRVDVHAVWVSPKVLQLLEPLPKTVEGGLIIRDDSGRPTGWFERRKMEMDGLSLHIFV